MTEHRPLFGVALNPAKMILRCDEEAIAVGADLGERCAGPRDRVTTDGSVGSIDDPDYARGSGLKLVRAVLRSRSTPAQPRTVLGLMQVAGDVKLSEP
jgi:hypothetical protein